MPIGFVNNVRRKVLLVDVLVDVLSFINKRQKSSTNTSIWNIFGMAAMPFLHRGVQFSPKLSYHRNVSLAVNLPIFFFFVKKQICICINGPGCRCYCLLFSDYLGSKYLVTTCFKFWNCIKWYGTNWFDIFVFLNNKHC